MQTLFGYDLSTGTKWVIAFAVILVLLALLGLFARQIKGGRLRMKGQGGGRARLPRLGVVDTHDLDRQRQLVLIRRDNVEHLIMIGGLSDVVVESNIVRGGQRSAMPGQMELGLPERPLAMEAPLPAEPPRAEPAPEPRRSAPPPAEPLPPLPLPPLPPRPAQPAPAPASQVGVAITSAAAGAGVAAALGAASRAPSPPAPNFARDPAPAPAVSASELDDMARQLEEALKRPHSAVRSSQTPAETPVEPKTEPPGAPEPAPLPSPEPPAVIELPPPAEPQAPMPSPPAPPVTTGQPTPPPLDVAAELELALGLKPERIAPKPPELPPIPAPPPVFAPPPPFVAPAAAPVADASPAKPEAEAKPASEPEEAAEPDDGLFAEPEDVPEPIGLVTPPEPEPEGDAEPEAVAPAPEPEPKPAAIDPFSVDAIEAEFARLLGRDPKPKG